MRRGVRTGLLERERRVLNVRARVVAPLPAAVHRVPARTATSSAEDQPGGLRELHGLHGGDDDSPDRCAAKHELRLAQPLGRVLLGGRDAGVRSARVPARVVARACFFRVNGSSRQTMRMQRRQSGATRRG